VELGKLIAKGDVESAVVRAKELVVAGDWVSLATEIADALGRKGEYFTHLASQPREKCEFVLRELLPCAVVALERGGHSDGLEYLLASAIALDFPVIAKEVAEELVNRKRWEEISQGIAEAFGKNGALFTIFSRNSAFSAGGDTEDVGSLRLEGDGTCLAPSIRGEIPA